MAPPEASSLMGTKRIRFVLDEFARNKDQKRKIKNDDNTTYFETIERWIKSAWKKLSPSTNEHLINSETEFLKFKNLIRKIQCFSNCPRVQRKHTRARKNDEDILVTYNNLKSRLSRICNAPVNNADMRLSSLSEFGSSSDVEHG